MRRRCAAHVRRPAWLEHGRARGDAATSSAPAARAPMRPRAPRGTRDLLRHRRRPAPPRAPARPGPALRLPPDRDAAVRAGRRLRARHRRGDRRRREGAVPARAADRGRRGLGAPARADRRHRPGLRPARDADLAAAREADDDRADVPLRPAAGRPLPPVLAVRRRGDRRSGTGRRRRDHRARAALLPRRRPRRTSRSSSTRSATGRAGRRTSRS